MLITPTAARPAGRIAHEFKDDPREISAALGGANFGFTVLGAVAAQTTAVLGAGVDVQLGQSFWLNVNWRSDIGSHYSDHAVQAGILFQF